MCLKEMFKEMAVLVEEVGFSGWHELGEMGNVCDVHNIKCNNTVALDQES